jgi:acyl carrier protein
MLRKMVLFVPEFSLNPTEMSEIAEKVKSIIVDKLGVEPSEVTPEASFTNDLGADSLDTVELIMEFEKEFNVSIPDDQAENIGTVGQAIAYLEEHAK